MERYTEKEKQDLSKEYDKVVDQLMACAHRPMSNKKRTLLAQERQLNELSKDMVFYQDRTQIHKRIIRLASFRDVLPLEVYTEKAHRIATRSQKYF